MTRHNVFAYGSNMHLRDLRRWMHERGRGEPGVHGVDAAVLEGWELVWNYYSPTRRGGAANVQRRSGGVVHGVILRIDGPTLAAVDAKEGHPSRYSRGQTQVSVRVPARALCEEAWVYEVLPHWRSETPMWPLASYLALVAEAAGAHGLPEAWIQRLRETTTGG